MGGGLMTASQAEAVLDHTPDTAESILECGKTKNPRNFEQLPVHDFIKHQAARLMSASTAAAAIRATPPAAAGKPP